MLSQLIHSPIVHPLPPEVCADCGQPIAEKETPRLWKERVVCSICHERLEDQQLIFRAFGKAVPEVGWRAAQFKKSEVRIPLGQVQNPNSQIALEQARNPNSRIPESIPNSEFRK